MSFFFIGERPSRTALKMKVRWEDGRLAAKQLFDAMTVAGLDPQEQRFTNLFVTNGTKLRLRPGVLATLKLAGEAGWILVGMGSLVHESLMRHRIKHLHIVHPAARGKIRKKATYAEHVRSVLTKSKVA